MKRTVRTILSITLIALLCGCMPEGGNINDNPDAGSARQQYDKLLDRPNLEQATEKYRQLLSDIKTSLRQRFGLPDWELRDDEAISGAGCGFDFPDVELPWAMTRTIDGGFTRAALPPDQWKDATGLVTQLANQYGFKGPERVADKPDQRSYNYYDSAGTILTWGQGKNMGLSISTGCFLTPEAHRESAASLAENDPEGQ